MASPQKATRTVSSSCVSSSVQEDCAVVPPVIGLCEEEERENEGGESQEHIAIPAERSSHVEVSDGGETSIEYVASSSSSSASTSSSSNRRQLLLAQQREQLLVQIAAVEEDACVPCLLACLLPGLGLAHNYVSPPLTI